MHRSVSGTYLRSGTAFPHVWTWLFVPVLVLGLAILFRIRRRDMVWPLLGGLLVWCGLEAGAGLGPWQGTFAGAFLLTAASGMFTRWSGLPPSIVMLPAVMVLVPGVAALRALYDGQAAVSCLRLYFCGFDYEHEFVVACSSLLRHR